MTGKKAEDHSPIEHDDKHGYSETLNASAEPGLTNQVSPQTKNPAACPDVISIPAKAPDKQTTDRNHH